MGELLSAATSFLAEYGYLSKAAARKVGSFDDPVLRAAMARYQRTDANVERFKLQTGEDLLPDGKPGPATLMAMALPRCGHPDVGKAVELPALGAGGWKNCHGADGHHQAVAHINYANSPDFLRGDVWKQVLKNTQRAYAEIGLLWRFIDDDSIDQITGEDLSGRVTSNTRITFTRGNGWIGLAIVGNGANQQCSSRIWAQFDYRYRGGSSTEAIVNQWTSLVMHELGHNCSLQHSRGGIMNPGIINGLPMSWRGDPHEGTLRRLFGGEPVEIPGDPKTPKPPSPPEDEDRPRVGQPLGEPFTWWDGTRCQTYRVLGGA